ncbi:MAG: SRPBCC family protein [Actinobacteria bacterium]|nr:SRPBCC family protein [Actinomycetota bacterium]
MTTVTRTFSVDTPANVVVAYLADFGNAEQWDPGTEECSRQDTGPVRVGSSWRNVSKIAGISTELIYTLEEFSDDHIVLVGRNDTATSTETIEVTATGSGSDITYTNEVEFHGAARAATPVAKLVFEKLGNDTEKQLVEVLNGLA